MLVNKESIKVNKESIKVIKESLQNLVTNVPLWYNVIQRNTTSFQK